MIIRKILVHAPGEPAAGLGPEDAEIHATGDFLLNLAEESPEERAATLADLRQSLAAVFEGMWGQAAQVRFDHELPPDPVPDDPKPSLRTALEVAVKALTIAEWGGSNNPWSLCPVCLLPKRDGHHPTCNLAQALTLCHAARARA